MREKKSGAQHKNESNAGHPPKLWIIPQCPSFPSPKITVCTQLVSEVKYHSRDLNLLIWKMLDARFMFGLLPGTKLLICDDRIDHDNGKKRERPKLYKTTKDC